MKLITEGLVEKIICIVSISILGYIGVSLVQGTYQPDEWFVSVKVGQVWSNENTGNPNQTKPNILKVISIQDDVAVVDVDIWYWGVIRYKVYLKDIKMNYDLIKVE